MASSEPLDVRQRAAGEQPVPRARPRAIGPSVRHRHRAGVASVDLVVPVDACDEGIDGYSTRFVFARVGS